MSETLMTTGEKMEIYQSLGFDPQDFDSLFNMQRREDELEKFLLFGIFVAGKNSKTTANSLNKMLAYVPNSEYPAEHFVRMGEDYTKKLMKDCGLGCYSQRWNSIVSLYNWLKKYESNNTLRTCTLDQLLEIDGVGDKTARFFLMYNRPNQRHAVIDRHIISYMNDNNIFECKMPINTKQYKLIERVWLDHFAEDIEGEDYYAKQDFTQWATYAIKA